jgi:valyl-tRNA synthetase
MIVRYTKYIRKEVINPVNQERMLVIADEYVTIDFSTTPAHDINTIMLLHPLKLAFIL